ncbi:MAG: tetratricopeptide repeat protein [Ignavibacteria bacterium]|nr:tetratricopeptide repeat protein [Ignavibacteria bacterium]
MNIESLKSLLDQAEEHILKGNFDEASCDANQVLHDVESFLAGVGGLTEKTIDSLQTIRCAALITLGRISYWLGDYQPALTLARTALAIAEEDNFPDYRARALNTIGAAYQKLWDNDNALEYLHKALAINEELGNEADRARNLATIGAVYSNLSDNPKALEYFQTALAICEELGSKEGIARNLANIGGVYYSLSDNLKALEYFQTSLALYHELGSKIRIADNLDYIGNVYRNLSDYAKALEYHQKALAIHEEIGNKNGIAGNLHNIGLVYTELGYKSEALDYFHKAMAINEETGNKAWLAINLAGIGLASDYQKSMEYLHKSLAINEELGNKDVIANNLTNIGWGMCQNKSDYSQAFEYMQRALTLYEEAESMEGIARNLSNIGIVYSAREFADYNPVRAEEYLLNSLAMSREIGNKKIEYEVYQYLAELYKNEKRWEEAHKYLEQFIALEKETLSEEAKHKAVLMEQRRQAEEREKEIAIAKAATEAKHQATEQLLHNVLPRSIADKMLDGTKLIAEKIPSVSVMFADIVNFTKLSQRITPEELVEGLDRIFSSFDSLAEKYGLEKIKTIGDAYMVVSGAPLPRPDHAEAMAHFALEMMESMKEFRSISTGEEIQLRIGIHSGEVVAGVIGKKKFAYDLWGDAVNTASRMESHGEAGKIHVSEEFLKKLLMVNGEWLIDDADNFSSLTINHLPLTIIPRGEMAIKGKGMMKTYFLERFDGNG